MWTTIAIFGCNYAATPRIEDAAAPRDYYRLARPPEKKCTREIPILGAQQPPIRPYDELRTISATCYPGARGVCERSLTERACEVGADALILLDPQAQGSPPGGSSQSQISINARAIRYKSD